MLSLLYRRRPLDYHILVESGFDIPFDDEKSIHSTFEQAKQQQTKRPAYRPKPDHAWKRSVQVALDKREAKGTF
mgnify:CR=1 FL=1